MYETHSAERITKKRTTSLQRTKANLPECPLRRFHCIHIFVCKVDYRLLSVTCHAQYKSFGLLNWHSFFIDTCACVISSQKV